MRLTFLIVLLCVLQSFAIDSFSQNQKLSINQENIRVESILQMIEERTDYYFMYSARSIDVKRTVNLELNDCSVPEILNAVFKNTDVTYKIDGRLIALSKDSEGISTVNQQLQTVTGHVTDPTGTPLPGVTVVVKGTTNGAITDSDGHYLIADVHPGAILVFSFVGMRNQEIPLDGKTTIDVVLQEETIGLEEVVAIGYGTQTKVTITGAVVSTKGEELIKSKTPNVLNSLTGHLAGVTVNNRSGEPGKDDPTILIRGMSTTGSTSPLILIDGIESSDLGRINPNDIESMSVLKDASAAIYGARAANGVILITTKSGKKGAPVFSFDYNQGFSQPTRKLKMANSYTFAKVYNEIEIGEGRTAKYSDEELQKFQEGTEPGYTTTYWYDEMIKNLTPQHQANLSVSGGTDRLDYYISLGQLGQDGIFEYGTTNVKRYNFRSKINIEANDYIRVGLDISGRLDDKHYPGNPDTRGIFSHIFLYQPDWTLFWPGTDYIRPNRDNESLANWVSDASGSQDETYKAIEAKLHFKIDIPWVKGLSVSGSANYNTGHNFIKYFDLPTYVYYYDESTDTYTEGRSGDGSDLAALYETFNQNKTLTLNSQINYTKQLNNHKIDLMAGYEQMEYDYDYLYAYRTDFPSTSLPQLDAGSSDKGKQGNSGTASATSRQNYFGRATYDYAGKYMAQLIFRYDGSPNFPKNKRWGFFPGVSLGWRISEESFMKNQNFIQNLKIRGSYGELGNDNVNPYQYLTTYSYGNNYVLGGSDVVGLTQSSVPNPNITWEVAKSTNIGIDATIREGALSMELDLFKTRRSNILTTRTAVIPDYTGLELPDENVGIVENKGIELQLTHQRQLNDKLRYSIRGNMSYARNKVIFIDEAPASEDYQLATGRPIGSQLMYDAIGIFKDQEQIDATPHMEGARPGDIIYRDVNGDKEINSRDMIRIDQTATPEIVYSLIGTINYKNWDLSVMFQGQENAKTYMTNQSEDPDDDFNPYFTVMSYGLGNFLQWRADDRWSPENTDASQPRGSTDNFNNNNRDASTHWLMDAGFLRLKNIEIGYTLPTNLCQKIGLKSLRAYINGNNLLFIYDHMKDIGFDPETVDFFYYPQQRTFNLGINLTF
jgi:TonB-linked SusC/RagA family outer membrane protein